MGDRKWEAKNFPVTVYIRYQNEATESAPSLQGITLEEGQMVAKEEATPSTLIFILSGCLKSIPLTLWPTERELPKRCLFLIPDSESFYGQAAEPTVLFCCTFRRHHVHWDHLAAPDSPQPADTPLEASPCIQPLPPALQSEVESALLAPAPLLQNPDYARHKSHLLALLMEQLYTPEELYRLLCPLLRRAPGFREIILRNYRDINRIKDLSKKLNIPSTTFNRKFREAFGMGAKEWLTRKREEHLLRDILLTDLSLNEIADKYELSPNYLMKVCKDTFHKTFTELRGSRHGKD